MIFTSGVNRPGLVRVLIKALIFLLIISVSSCTGNRRGEKGRQSKPESESSFLLGTLVELSFYGGDYGKDVFREAFRTISQYENILSRNISTSEISALNRNSGTSSVKISESTYFLMEKGHYYSDVSGGLFDISIGPLVSLWGIGTEDAKVPSVSEIEKAVKLVDYRKISLVHDQEKGEYSAFLEKQGMQVDLGAIAKGYIADQVKELVTGRGVNSAIINLGGNVLLVGKKPDGSFFRIGIQDPFDNRGKYLGILEAEDVSIVTSGIYERYFEEDGRIYHHILDPVTGFPVENEIMGISVITEKSVDGDALSTALFMLGLEKAVDFVNSRDSIDAIIISRDKKIYLAGNFSERFRLIDPEFSIAE